jgi:hypothetical protein
VFRKEIIVTVRRRDGRVEARRVVVDEKVGDGQGGDLVTLWAFRIISCLFAVVPKGVTTSISFVDLSGVSRTQGCIYSHVPGFLSSICAERAPYIGFGSSPALPSRSDSRLYSELARVRGSTYSDESAFVLTIAGSWTPDSGVNVCEVGLYMYVCESSTVARYMLFDRSVLDSCIGVGAGETISVSYVFRF